VDAAPRGTREISVAQLIAALGGDNEGVLAHDAILKEMGLQGVVDGH
jgi:hypothetical protein